MKKKSSLLLLLGGASLPKGLRCIKQAQARGLQVWLTDTSENLEQAADVVALADRVSPLPYHDLAACVAWVTEKAHTETFLGVFGFRERSVEAVNAVAQFLQLPGNPLDAVHRVRNKFACRQWLRERGFRQPMAAICTNLQQALKFIEMNPPGPWIVKPPSALGSVGVSLVQKPADLVQAITYLTSSQKDLAASFEQQGVSQNSQDEYPFIVECFQPGEEFSAEGLFVYGTPHVLALTAKITTHAPHFVEIGHSLSAELTPEIQQTVKSTIGAALKDLNLCWGIFHVEFWLENDLPVLGEVHIRPGGDYIDYMVEHVTGIDIYGTLFEQLLDTPLDPHKWQPYRGAAMRYLTPAPGRIAAIHGWDEVTAHPDYLMGMLTMHEGDDVSPLHSYLDRSSFILTTGQTAHLAAQTAESLCNQIKMEIQA